MEWLAGFRDSVGAPDHKTSPIVCFVNPDNSLKYLGGRDDTLAWCRRILSTDSSNDEATVAVPNVDAWNAQHTFDYDLVVIGGGSGGLACSKEAKKAGATKVAVLDYVKPSPLGTKSISMCSSVFTHLVSHVLYIKGSKWGLGGTCVNVGCIPKKLMHYAALLGDYAQESGKFGWQAPTPDTSATTLQHSWDTLRDNVQDHIKGINFGYRVELREQGVTYLNKLGKFVGPNTLEVTDAKGKTATITAARFVIATGGRPTPLSIPGAELAISSDDIFSLPHAPGKTCVIGAGYIALECAGFLAGLKQGAVDVLVRSTPLRTFDQDTVGYVSSHLRDHAGVQLIEGVVPKSIVKLPSGRLSVTFGKAQSTAEDRTEEYDTVLSATGRTPDLQALGLDTLGLTAHPESGKLVTTNEQTTIPHIYAIGDIVHGGLELTPVAILAGKLLARRLFGQGTDLVDYKNIASVVFTPLELGTVGYSEADAIEAFGAENVDAYVSQFVPLEWTLQENPPNCFAKVVIRKTQQRGKDVELVVGIHIASPHASEIVQGYALAMKQGLTMQTLLNETIGIHPTIGEELTLMKVTKSSSASFKKTGC